MGSISEEPLKPTRRVLLLCQHFYPEMISTGMHMTELSVALAKLGWQITVCSAQPTLLPEKNNQKVPCKMEYCGIKILRVPSLGGHSGGILNRFVFAITYLVMSTLFVIRNIKGFDGVLITTNPPFLGLLGWMISRLFTKPFILIVYDIYPEIVVKLGWFKPNSVIVRIWDYIARLILNGSACNVVIGRDMQELVTQKMKPDRKNKILLIPNWSDDEVVYPVPKSDNSFKKEFCPDDSLVVQYSGRMGRTHNIEPLIEAAELLKDKPFIFQFIGEGAKKSVLQGMSQKKGLKNVYFLPYQPFQRLSEVLSAADVAVVCLESVFTGLSVPSKTYGIMAAATPIIGLLNPLSEIGRTIIENNCGIVLDNPTGASVAKVLLQWLDNREHLQMMGRRGYEAFKRNYTLKVAAQRYSNLMSEVF